MIHKHTQLQAGREGVEAKHIPTDNRRNTGKQIKRYFCHVAVAVASRSSQRHRGAQALFVSLARIASPDSRCPMQMPAMSTATATVLSVQHSQESGEVPPELYLPSFYTVASPLFPTLPPFALSHPRCHPLLLTQSR